MYVRGRIFFLAPWPLYARVHAMCAPLLRHVPFLTRPRFIAAACRQTDRMYIHVPDQNDNATYASTRWVPTVREDKESLLCVRRCSWWVPAVRGETFFSQNTVARPVGPCCQ